MSTPGDNEWKWSNEHGDYYRYTWNTDGTWGRVEWGRSRLPDPDSPPMSRPLAAPQQPQPHPYQSSGPANTAHMQYPYSDPNVPLSSRPVQPQHPSQYPPQYLPQHLPQQPPQPQYNLQHSYQPNPYQEVPQAQTSQHSTSYQAGQDRGNTQVPTTPSNPSNPELSSPASAQSGGTQESTYSPPNSDTYPQGPVRWPPRRPGQ